MIKKGKLKYRLNSHKHEEQRKILELCELLFACHFLHVIFSY